MLAHSLITGTLCARTLWVSGDSGLAVHVQVPAVPRSHGQDKAATTPDFPIDSPRLIHFPSRYVHCRCFTQCRQSPGSDITVVPLTDAVIHFPQYICPPPYSYAHVIPLSLTCALPPAAYKSCLRSPHFGVYLPYHSVFFYQHALVRSSRCVSWHRPRICSPAGRPWCRLPHSTHY